MSIGGEDEHEESGETHIKCINFYYGRNSADRCASTFRTVPDQ
jgi:hypothetical protein